MTLAARRRALGKQPFQVVELYLDACQQLNFGEGTCEATGEPCYKTRASCKDPAHYLLGSGAKVHRFISQNARVPDGLEGAIPCLLSVAPTAAQIDPDSGMGMRASVQVALADFPHSDIGVDPYVFLRSYNPLNQGTYFGKLRARNPYYNGRRLRVLTGYLTDDGAFVEENFEARNYFIEGWAGPSGTGQVSITGKDVLKFASDDRAQAPFANSGKLAADIDAAIDHFTLTPTGIGDLDYSESGWGRIGSELVQFTRAGDVVSIVRGQYNTLPAEHSADDTFQECLVFMSQKPQDILYTLLTKFAKIDPVYLGKAQWDAEQVGYMPRLYSRVITSPTGVSKLITEMSEQMGFYIWWQEVQQLVLMRAVRPAESSEIRPMGEAYDVVENGVTVRDLTDKRINEVWIFFGLIDPTQKLDEPSNYRITYVKPALDNQDPAQDGDVRVKKIFAGWITQENAVAAFDLADKIIARSKITPVELTISATAKDGDIDVADFLSVQTRQQQDFTGAPATVTVQVLRRTEPVLGTSLQLLTRQANIESAVPSTERNIVIAADTFVVNLRSLHDSIYAAPIGGETINCIIRKGVKIGGRGKNFLFGIMPFVFTSPFAPRGNIAVAQVANPDAIESSALYNDGLFGGGPATGTDQEIATAFQGFVWRYASNSFRTGNWPPGCTLKVTLEEGAQILGEGGNGTPIWTAAFGRNMGPSSGGNAFVADYPVMIESHGTIAGGGASGIGTSMAFATPQLIMVHAGGGAGFGASDDIGDAYLVNGARGGRVGTNSWYELYTNYQTILENTQPTEGTPSAPGNGGRFRSTGYVDAQSTAGMPLGTDCVEPFPGVVWTDGFGKAGKAVIGNDKITWLNAGTLIGPVT